MASVAMGTTKHYLPQELAAILPREGVEYFSKLNELRFVHRPESDYTFLDPNNLVSLLIRALQHRGTLTGDDRLLIEMQGAPAAAFDLPAERYSYLQVPIEGRVGNIPISELPEWVPVTVENAADLPQYSLRSQAQKGVQLAFSVDSEFRRMINYATLIIAPNLFDNPSTPRAILDVTVGYPPHGQRTLPQKHPGLKKAGIKPGSRITVGDLKALKGTSGLIMGCHLRNLPGRR